MMVLWEIWDGCVRRELQVTTVGDASGTVVGNNSHHHSRRPSSANRWHTFSGHTEHLHAIVSSADDATGVTCLCADHMSASMQSIVGPYLNPGITPSHPPRCTIGVCAITAAGAGLLGSGQGWTDSVGIGGTAGAGLRVTHGSNVDVAGGCMSEVSGPGSCMVPPRLSDVVPAAYSSYISP